MNDNFEPVTKSDLKSFKIEIKTDISELKADVSNLKADVSELKTDVSKLKSDVSELKSNTNMIIDMLEVMNDRMEKQHQTDSSRMEVLIEDAEDRFLKTNGDQVSLNTDKIDNHEGRIIHLEKFRLAA